MQAADDVKFRNCLTVTGSRSFECFIQSHCVRAGRVFFSTKSAQPAGGNTNVRRINMAIDVEVCLVAVHSSADVISQPTDSENIPGAIQRDAIIKVEAFAGKHLLVDWFK